MQADLLVLVLRSLPDVSRRRIDGFGNSLGGLLSDWLERRSVWAGTISKSRDQKATKLNQGQSNYGLLALLSA